MKTFIVDFTTTISGQMTIKAKDEDAARDKADQLADDTVNYDELTNGGEYVPEVETEVDDITEVDD